jgi:hypothetical protein
MKRVIAVLPLLVVLTGCVPPSLTAPSNEPTPHDMAVWRDEMDKPIIAARSAYLQKHPDNPYAKIIEIGGIAVGMSSSDVDAAGFACEIKEDSTMGSIQACKSLTEDNYAASLGVENHSTYYVGFDETGKVLSVQYP